MLTHITFKFTIGQYFGSMGMVILVNNKEILHQDFFDSDVFEISTEMSWPGDIVIKVYSKGPKDTEVRDGKITADKYIRLDELIVDKVPVDQDILRELVTLDTSEKLLKELYWGFNGTVTLNFEEADSFIWFLTKKSKKYNTGTAPSSEPGKLDIII